MKDKNINNLEINGRKYPQPDVSADAAWEKMHEMLIENNLTQTKRKNKRRWIIWFYFFLILAGIVCGYWWHQPKTQQGKSGIKSDVLVSKTKKITDTIKTDFHEDTPLNRKNTGTIPGSIKHNAATDMAVHKSDIKHAKNFINSNESKQKINFNNPDTGTDTTVNSKIFQQEIHTNITQKNTQVENSISENTDSSNVTNAISEKRKADTTTQNKTNNNKNKSQKLHFGLEWKPGFSFTNNKYYFDNYSGGKQYYMWLLPSAWARLDLNKKQGITLTFNPYLQNFTDRKTVHIEKPWIASVEPDIVTRLVKARSIAIGLDYSYQLYNNFSLYAGAGYSFIQDALFNEQDVEESTGNILSEKIYGASHKDAGFSFIKKSNINWQAGINYDFKKISIGLNISQPFTNMSSDSIYIIKPVNGSFYLKYRFK